MNTIADGTSAQAMMTSRSQQPAMHGALVQPAQPEELPTHLLSQLGPGVCVIDAGLELVYANALGEQLLCNRYFPGRSRFVPCEDPAESRRLRAALLDALSGHAQLIEIDLDGTRTLLALSSIELPHGRPGAVLTLERTEPVPDHVLQAYARLIRLTRRETAVAAALARGVDPGDAAEALGIAVETVRTHIRAILSKARARSMRELLVRISRLPPMMAASQPAKPKNGPAPVRTAMGAPGAPGAPVPRVVELNVSASPSQRAFCGGVENLVRRQVR